jgi:L-alanine-DL-glutamate epimerase-like enolase superfamily enzyme
MTAEESKEKTMRITRVHADWIKFPIEESRRHVSDFGRVASFDAAIVQIETDRGITGIGEAKNAAGSAGVYAALVALINDEIAPRLVGRDPRGIVAIWEELYNGVRAHYAIARGHVFPEASRRGISVAAISGIDTALWDILGNRSTCRSGNCSAGARRNGCRPMPRAAGPASTASASSSWATYSTATSAR